MDSFPEPTIRQRPVPATLPGLQSNAGARKFTHPPYIVLRASNSSHEFFDLGPPAGRVIPQQVVLLSGGRV